MNSDNLTHLLQQGFHVTLGATASLVETLQDPQKQNQNLSQLSLELSQLAQAWAAKGEMTEHEARNFVDNLLNQIRDQQPSPTTADSPYTVTTSPTQPAPPTLQLELQELTAQIAAIRVEIEKLRPDSNPS